MPQRSKIPVISGTIVDYEHGEPLAGYYIRVFRADRLADKDYIGQARVTKKGEFNIRFRKTREVTELLKTLARKRGPDLAFTVYDEKRVPVESLEPLSGKDRFIKHQFEVQGRAGQWLNNAFGDSIEKFLKQPQVLRLIAKELGEENDVDPKIIYKTLVDSDPFGISPFNWRTTICCVLNNLMDQFKQTSLASALVFGGNTYKHLWPVVVRGEVRGPITKGAFVYKGVERRNEIDEDFNFKLEPTLPTLNKMVAILWSPLRQAPNSKPKQVQITRNLSLKVFYIKQEGLGKKNVK